MPGHISKQLEEIAYLKAKIAQLVAIMPIMPESVGYHPTSAISPVVSSSGSMLRLSNGSPLMVNSNHQDMNNNGNERSLKMMGQSPQSQMFNMSQQQQHHQLAQQQQQQGSSAASSLDPNARSYTPVNTNSEVV